MKTSDDYRKEYEARVAQREQTREMFVKNFPTLFKNTHKDNLDCPKGWEKLVFELSEKLSEYPIQVAQVKSKFGTLRCYLNHESILRLREDLQAHVHALISEAEQASANICETCGTNVNVSRNNSGFVQTLCPVCRKNYDEK